ncbi:DUF4333 domain-containing protein [Crossiella sp. CA-258035]|uniref:DUF4333 domain-containing protein n=1 Tax=Crossiella sp. CA-258035 TaxID=2981138 RepID=UPI0024BD3F20|nr:DUF4333 domain-containing protein [Crossiella sp. CA-258035]WHT15755.1 DUF4333 domain-containing protein [Crossiella sp. CA-258035]
MMRFGRSGLAVCGVLVAALSGCAGAARPGAAPPVSSSAGPVFEVARVEDGVRKVLVDKYRVAGLASVRCPSGQPVVPSSSFACLVVVSGAAKQVRLTVRGADGSYEVGLPE